VTRRVDTALGALVALGLLALNVTCVSSRLGFLHKPKQVKEYDHWRYVEMARGEEGRAALKAEPPYCFRVAVPALVRGLSRLGLSVNAGFFLATNAALFGFLLVLWLHLRDLGFALPLRVAGLLVVGLTQGAVRWFEYQYWMTDPAALFLVMLAFLLLERRQWAALAATSILAAFVRETYVLVYPYVFLHELRRGPSGRGAVLPAAGRAAALAALPLAVLVAIRRIVTPIQPDDFVSGIVDSTTFRLNHLLDNQTYVVTIGAFGVLVPLLLLFPSRLPDLVRRHFDRALYVLSVYATLAISNNNERPLAYALPALVPAALWCLRAFLSETRLPQLPVLAAVVALQALFWTGQRWAEMGMSIYQPVNWTTTGAMASFWIAAQMTRRRRGSTPALGVVGALLLSMVAATACGGKACGRLGRAQLTTPSGRVTLGVDNSAPWELVYEHEVDGNLDIYVVPAQGGIPRRLTQDPAGDGHARWMPDGRRVVFTTGRTGKPQIWEVAADGGREHPLRRNAASESQPDPSPDGRHLAFISDIEGSDRLMMMDLDTRETVALVRHPDGTIFGNPHWSPDSSQVVFSSNWPDGHQIYVLDVPPRQERPPAGVKSGGCEPRFARDGRAVAYVLRGNQRPTSQLVELDLATGERRILVDWPALNYDLAYSPDGKEVAFASNITGEWVIYRQRLADRRAWRVTFGGGGARYPDYRPRPVIGAP
jgi:WD40-like Beta Propeller Repeat